MDCTKVRKLGRVTPKTNVQFSCGYKSLSVRMNRHSSDLGASWFLMITLKRFSVLNCWRLVSSLTRVLINLFYLRY